MKPEQDEHGACDICGRNLLLGERTRAYVGPDGEMAEVCDLCRHSLQAAGWVRSDIAADELLASVAPSRRRRDRIGVRLLRGRRRPSTKQEQQQAEPRVQAIRSEVERDVLVRVEAPEDTEDALLRVEPMRADSPPPAPSAAAPESVLAPYDAEFEDDALADQEAEALPASFDFPVRSSAVEGDGGHGARLAESEGEDESALEPVDPAPDEPLEPDAAESPVVAEPLEIEPEEMRIEDEAPVDEVAAPRRGLRGRLGRGGGEPRHVRAIPSRAGAKAAAALARFNESGYTRTVAGISRSLGSPGVSAEAADGPSTEVRITVAWEISWYQWLVDLSAEAESAVRKLGTGNELAELDDSSRAGNAHADEQGHLHPGSRE